MSATVDNGVTVELDPARVHTPEGNRQYGKLDVESLLASIAAQGQLEHGLVFNHPSAAGYYLCADGNRRLECCRLLGLKFKAVLLHGEPTRARVLQYRIVTAETRENLHPFDLCADIEELMKLEGCATGREMAERLQLSEATISRVTGTRRIPELLRERARLLPPTSLYIVSALPDAEQMEKAIAFTLDTTPRPTRDQLQRYVAELKGSKPARGKKPKALKGRVDGRRLEVGLSPSDTTESLIEFFKGMAAKLAKYRDIPPEGLEFLFAP